MNQTVVHLMAELLEYIEGTNSAFRQNRKQAFEPWVFTYGDYCARKSVIAVAYSSVI